MRCLTTGCQVGSFPIDYTGVARSVSSGASAVPPADYLASMLGSYQPAPDAPLYSLSDADAAALAERILQSMGLTEGETILSAEWQAMEREADEDIAAGRFAGTFKDPQDLIRHLRRSR